MLVFIVLLLSATFSTLYHVNYEQEYSDLDVIWASLAIVVALIMLAVFAMKYAPWNWRVMLPLVFGLTGLIIYFVGGHASGNCAAVIEDANYDLYHSLWHLFVGLAALVLVWTPANLMDAAGHSYGEIYQKIVENFYSNSVDQNSVLR